MLLVTIMAMGFCMFDFQSVIGTARLMTCWLGNVAFIAFITTERPSDWILTL